MAGATNKELADQFLADIGAPQNVNTEAAVIAWKRAESGNNVVRGNPFNVGCDAARTSGVKAIGCDTGVGPGIAIFASWQDGVKAAANQLQTHDVRLYGPAGDALKQGDAITFLTRLSHSAYVTGRPCPSGTCGPKSGSYGGNPTKLMGLFKSSFDMLNASAGVAGSPTGDFQYGEHGAPQPGGTVYGGLDANALLTADAVQKIIDQASQGQPAYLEPFIQANIHTALDPLVGKYKVGSPEVSAALGNQANSVAKATNPLGIPEGLFDIGKWAGALAMLGGAILVLAAILRSTGTASATPPVPPAVTSLTRG